jgi:hypothetical protein
MLRAITGAQIKAARALLGWSLFQLAQAAKVHPAVARRAEAGETDPPLTQLEEWSLRHVLEQAGVEFTMRGGPGVRLKAPARAEAAGEEATPADEPSGAAPEGAEPEHEQEPSFRAAENADRSESTDIEPPPESDRAEPAEGRDPPDGEEQGSRAGTGSDFGEDAEISDPRGPTRAFVPGGEARPAEDRVPAG